MNFTCTDKDTLVAFLYDECDEATRAAVTAAPAPPGATRAISTRVTRRSSPARHPPRSADEFAGVAEEPHERSVLADRPPLDATSIKDERLEIAHAQPIPLAPRGDCVTERGLAAE